MGSPFRDFIPEGEPTNAQGSGFKDFVPDPVPVAHVEPVEDDFVPPVPEKTNNELRNEAEALGINTTKLTNKKMLLDAIAAKKGV
jgi:hypothetical protein